MLLPVIQLKLCEYAELAANSIVINPVELDDSIHLNFRDPILLFRPIEIREITDSECDPLKFIHFSFQQGHPWIDVPSSELNQSPGYHKYLVRFLTKGDDTFSWYFSYTIQTESPDKPYIYMNPDDPVD